MTIHNQCIPRSYRTVNSCRTPTPTPSPEQIAEAQFGQVIPWFATPPDEVHRRMKEQIMDLWRLDPVLADTVAHFPSIVDGVDGRDRQTLGILVRAAVWDTEVAQRLSQVGWIADGITSSESDAFESLDRLIDHSPDFASFLVSLPWIADGINEPESRIMYLLPDAVRTDSRSTVALITLPWVEDLINAGETSQTPALLAMFEIALTNPAFAWQLASLPWVSDGLTRGEFEILVGLKSIPINYELVTEALTYEWVKDGLSRREQEAWFSLLLGTGQSPNSAYKLLKLPWFRDGLSAEGARSAGYIGEIALVSAEMAGMLPEYPWLANEPNYEVSEMLYGFSRLTGVDQELALRVGKLPWVTRTTEITSHHWDPVQQLAAISRDDPELARHIAGGFSDRTEWQNGALATAIRYLLNQQPQIFSAMRSQNWFQDGLNRDEVMNIIDAERALR